MRAVLALLALSGTVHAAPRSQVSWVADPPRTASATGGSQVRVYLNRHGGEFSYTEYGDDPANNLTGIVRTPSQHGHIDPWPYGDEAWSELTACIRSQFAAYDIEFVEDEPWDDEPYIEHVVGGNGSDLGRGDSGGIGSMYLSCDPMPGGMSFTFAESYAGDVHEMCVTAAQEIGHNLGLEHEYLASDPMTYLNGPYIKRFRDEEASCGEYSRRDCTCPRTTQNSYLELASAAGWSQVDPPWAQIVTPAEAHLLPGDALTVEAGAAAGLDRVELWADMDGTLGLPVRLGEDSAPDANGQYGVKLPPGLEVGRHQLYVRAYDQRGIYDEQAINFVVLRAPADPGDPGDPGNPGDPQDPTGGRDGTVAGGCSAGGQAGPGMLLVLGAMLLASGASSSTRGRRPRR